MSAEVQAKVADTIMQRPSEVRLGGKVYRVAPPSIGTLILVSDMISRLPEETPTRKGREKEDILAVAKDFELVPEILAALILGAKEINYTGKNFLVAKHRERKYNRLVGKLRDTASPEEVAEVIIPMLDSLQLKDFFVVTTFLQGINLTKPTKVETETEATASGQ